MEKIKTFLNKEAETLNCSVFEAVVINLCALLVISFYLRFFLGF